MIGCVSVTSGSVLVVVVEERSKASDIRDFEWILCCDGVRVVVVVFVVDDVIGVVTSVTAGW